MEQEQQMSSEKQRHHDQKISPKQISLSPWLKAVNSKQCPPETSIGTPQNENGCLGRGTSLSCFFPKGFLSKQRNRTPVFSTPVKSLVEIQAEEEKHRRENFKTTPVADVCSPASPVLFHIGTSPYCRSDRSNSWGFTPDMQRRQKPPTSFALILEQEEEEHLRERNELKTKKVRKRRSTKPKRHRGNS